MAPITDDTVEALRDTIRKLESRVHQLEAKMGGDHGFQSKSTLASVRMILMGPPGAGRGLLDSMRSAFNSLHGLQARERRHPRYKRNIVLAIWYDSPLRGCM